MGDGQCMFLETLPPLQYSLLLGMLCSIDMLKKLMRLIGTLHQLQKPSVGCYNRLLIMHRGFLPLKFLYLRYLLNDKMKKIVIHCVCQFQVVGIGLRSVFELIKESRIPAPDICTKALMALLDIIQYQSPEALKDEPSEVIGTFI